MRTRQLMWAVMAFAIALSLVGSFDWTPADASRLGQTVPTRTPTAAPITPAPEPPPATAVPSVESSPAATPVILLPTAGDSSGDALALWGMIGLGLLLLAWAIRLRARGNAR